MPQHVSWAGRYRKGARGERIVRANLEGLGYLVMRAYASIGPFDLMVVAPGGSEPYRPFPIVYLIECKVDTGRMSPAEREKLRRLADKYDCVPLLAHYTRGKTTYTHLQDEEGREWTPRDVR